MKFVGSVMENVNGVEWYSIVGILIFITLFIVILIRTFRMPIKDVNKFKNAILEDDESDELSNKNLKNI